jgi:hypothetical protein
MMGCQSHTIGGPTPENGHSVSPAVDHESSSSRAGMAGGLSYPTMQGLPADAVLFAERQTNTPAAEITQ